MSGITHDLDTLVDIPRLTDWLDANIPELGKGLIPLGGLHLLDSVQPIRRCSVRSFGSRQFLQSSLMQFGFPYYQSLVRSLRGAGAAIARVAVRWHEAENRERAKQQAAHAQQ